MRKVGLYQQVLSVSPLSSLEFILYISSICSEVIVNFLLISFTAPHGLNSNVLCVLGRVQHISR